MGPRWLSWHLHKGVAQTLADALDGDLGVAVVVAVIVAHTHLRKIDFKISVDRSRWLFSVRVCELSTDQLAVVRRWRGLPHLGGQEVREAFAVKP